MFLPIGYLHQDMEIPYYRHEKWDGTGYSCGLIGKQIPLASRIFDTAIRLRK
ncbi:HD domain-containing phosphohydrolase [Desulfofarcimen acetoxidans]|uniref:HD domain-containing phosphohydrolase n=1 Tax=Desulfofarcimen acetoxidans TaxID=58138 RepID=UPI000A00E86C